MRRLMNEQNFTLLLSLVTAIGLWMYVTLTRAPLEFGTPKSVAVIPTIVGTPEFGYSILSVRVVPQTVNLSGSPAHLATLESVITEPINITGAIRDVVQEVSVVTPPGLTSSRRVQVSVQIAPAVAVTLVQGVRVEVRNVPSGAVAEVDPKTIQVQVQGPISVVSRLRPEDFLARVDGNVQEGRRRVKVIIEAPEQVELLAVMPAEVVVTVRKDG
jgi:YbbR domain-containing protein